MTTLNLKYLNKKLKNKKPEEIIDWALSLSKKRYLTTSFGKYSAVILNAFFNKDKKINVIWCDTGYNTEETLQHATNLIDKFELNMYVYKPLNSKTSTDATMGLSTINNPKLDEFTEIVKLEPFRRAIQEHNPDVWFTNIRKRQTEYRSSKNILSYSKDGILKVSPFYYWTDKELDNYLEDFSLPKNETYFDVTKVLTNRECGLHLQ